LLRIRTCEKLSLHTKCIVSVHCFIKHRVRLTINHQLLTIGICIVQNNWTPPLLHMNLPSFHAQSTKHERLKKGTVPISAESNTVSPQCVLSSNLMSEFAKPDFAEIVSTDFYSTQWNSIFVLPTPWRRVLVDKLIVPQLVRTLLAPEGTLPFSQQPTTGP